MISEEMNRLIEYLKLACFFTVHEHLYRDYHEKKEVRIYDYLDSKIDTAMKMYSKRCKGYRSMGYEIVEKE